MRILTLLLLAVLLQACFSQKQAGLPPELLQETVEALEEEASQPIETESNEEPQEVVSLQTGEDLQGEYCQTLAKGLVEAFEDINYCEIDDDCSIAPGVCPFGCYFYYNQNLNFGPYERDINKYKEKCNPCEYKCEAESSLEAPKCIDNKCIVPQSL